MRNDGASPAGGSLNPPNGQTSTLRLELLKPFVTSEPKSKLEIWMPTIAAAFGIIGALGGVYLARWNGDDSGFVCECA
jgi:hypothetical protein